MFWKSWRNKETPPENHDLLSFNIINESVLLISDIEERSDDDPVVEDRFTIPPDEITDNPADNAVVSPLLKEPTDSELSEILMRQLNKARKIARYMQSTDGLVEGKIRKAMEQGYFDEIEGKGKPLNLEENPYEDPSLRLPFKMLKDAGFAPYWIELGKEIDAEIEGARTNFDKLLDGLRWRKKRKGFLDWNPEMEDRRDYSLQSCARKFEEANKKVDLYNRIVPIYWMQRKKVDKNLELSKLREKWDDVVKPTLLE